MQCERACVVCKREILKDLWNFKVNSSKKIVFGVGDFFSSTNILSSDKDTQKKEDTTRAPVLCPLSCVSFAVLNMFVDYYQHAQQQVFLILFLDDTLSTGFLLV